MRLFFACWPPAGTAQALARWASEVRNDSGGKLIAVENIHLTLAFLGEAQPESAIAAARQVKAGRHEVPIEAARYVKRNKMVWIGPQSAPSELASLAAQLREQLIRAGFKLEERPFAAHVTLIRKARQPKSIPPLPQLAWPVEEFLLVSSRISSPGSSYTPIERFALR